MCEVVSIMKTLLCLSAALLVVLGSIQAEAPSALEFGKVTFKKAFSDKSEAGPFSEYLPAGQKLETWTKLMGYFVFSDPQNPMEAATLLARVVKEQNPGAQANVITNDATGEAIVDFVTWPKDQAFIEFNIWKYRKAPQGGLIALQYAERAYDGQTDFLKNLKDRRSFLIETMAGDVTEKR